MDFDNIIFEDVIADAEKKKEKKKPVNSGDKGDRTERNLAKLLKQRFNLDFIRTVGSGNRWGQVVFIPKHAQNVFSGDLVCPENFKFVVECKGGYNDVEIHCIFEKGLKKIDEWIEQVSDEATRCGKLPLIAWKRDYKPWIVFVRRLDMPANVSFDYLLEYREWCIISFSKLLEQDNSYFFDAAPKAQKRKSR